MIAKATPIDYGGNAIRYAVNKDKAELVKVHNLPEELTAEGMYHFMKIHCMKHQPKIQRGSPFKDTVLRIEISPSAEETIGWTLADWRKLAEEFIRIFDSIDMSKKAKRKNARSTNLQNSMYVVSLHRDAESGILHLHIDACRIDQDGNMNCGNLLGERAVKAAKIINEQRGWEQPEVISARHKKEISTHCMAVLRDMKKFSWDDYEQMVKKTGYGIKIKRDNEGKVRAYSISRGNSSYKSSQLGLGRNLTPSKIEQTWNKLHPQQDKPQLHNPVTPKPRTAAAPSVPSTPKAQPVYQPVMKHYDISTRNERQKWHIAVPDFVADIINKECSLQDANPLAKIEEIQRTALLLFAGYIDGATSMAVESGGGGNAPTSGWGKKDDEDDRMWAHRCAQMANRMCRWTRKKGMGY